MALAHKSKTKSFLDPLANGGMIALVLLLLAVYRNTEIIVALNSSAVPNSVQILRQIICKVTVGHRRKNARTRWRALQRTGFSSTIQAGGPAEQLSRQGLRYRARQGKAGYVPVGPSVRRATRRRVRRRPAARSKTRLLARRPYLPCCHSWQRRRAALA